MHRNVIIRREMPEDHPAVRRANEQAFGRPFVIVLGHPDYYPTFGFVPASRLGIRCEYEGVPDEAFMILVLKDEAMTGISGLARYRPEFADV